MERRQGSLSINSENILKIANNILDDSLYNNREYELLWILWLCKLLKIKFAHYYNYFAHKFILLKDILRNIIIISYFPHF